MMGFIKFIFVTVLMFVAFEYSFGKLELAFASQYYDKLPYTVIAACDKYYETPKVKDEWGMTKGGGGSSYKTRARCNTAKEAGNYYCQELRVCVSQVEEYMEDLGYEEPIIYLQGRFPKGCKDFGDETCGNPSLISCRKSGDDGYRDAPITHDTTDDYQNCYPNLEPKEQGGDLDIPFYGYFKGGMVPAYFIFFWWLTGYVMRKIRKATGFDEE